MKHIDSNTSGRLVASTQNKNCTQLPDGDHAMAKGRRLKISQHK